jgi:hypothetical protein
MRLASAIGIVALALATAACRTPGGHSAGEKELAAKLVDLGIEGRTYVNDLGQVATMRLGRVYRIGDDLLVEDLHGHLTYVDGATLNPRWVYTELPGPFDYRPDSTQTAIVGVSHGMLFVIARDNGVNVVEPRRIDIVASGAPVATDATIYVPTFRTPSGNKTMQSINLATGFLGWGWRTDSQIVRGMAKGGAGAGDEFYFVTEDGILYAFPPYLAGEHTVDVGWTRDLHGAVTSDLVVDGQDLGVVMTDGRLVCVDRVDGHVRWEAYAERSERAQGSAMFSSGLVFYNCGGQFRAFDRETGAKAWALPGAGQFIAERGGRLLVLAGGDMLLSVDKKTGAVLGHASVKGWQFPPRTSADSTIFAISRYGVIQAVEFGF